MRPRMRALALLTVVALTLAACGSSRLNPLNWFSRSSSAPTLGETWIDLDRRPPVPDVTALTIERTATGAIVRAEAVMPTAGYWDPALIPENGGRPVDGVLTYRFVAAPPRTPIAVNSEAPRTLTAAAVLTNFDLEVVREVVVVGARTTRRSRR